MEVKSSEKKKQELPVQAHSQAGQTVSNGRFPEIAIQYIVVCKLVSAIYDCKMLIWHSLWSLGTSERYLNALLFVPPLRGLITSYNSFPTAYAVGYYCDAPTGA